MHKKPSYCSNDALFAYNAPTKITILCYLDLNNGFATRKTWKISLSVYMSFFVDFLQ